MRYLGPPTGPHSHQHNLIFVVKVFKINANVFKANKEDHPY